MQNETDARLAGFASVLFWIILAGKKETDFPASNE